MTIFIGIALIVIGVAAFLFLPPLWGVILIALGCFAVFVEAGGSGGA